MFPFDYISEIAEGAISKLDWYCQILILLIAAIICVICYIYKDKIIELLKKHSKCVVIILVILIVCLVAVSTFGYLYSPKPPEDQLVVAISPFYYIDESGQTGADINTANDFKERLDAENGLGIKVIMLDVNNPICDKEDAKFQGKKVGAHLVVYGETKKKIGNIGEVKYYILPLPSWEIHEEVKGSPITEKVTFSMVTEEPIIIVESLIENASSAIYSIGAFENYYKSDFTSAISFLEAIKNYENHSLILFCIGTCYLHNNNSDESVRYFDSAIEIDPQLAEAWCNKGFALDEFGRYEEAIVAFDKAIEIDPQLAEAWNNKAFALAKLVRNEEAIVAFDKAIEIDPQYAWAWSYKGVAFDELDRYEEAIAAFDKAIEINPQDAWAWCNKGVALGKLGRYEEAIIAFDKVIEIDPQDAEAWNNKGVTLYDLGRHEEAIEAFDKAIDIDPQHSHIHI